MSLSLLNIGVDTVKDEPPNRSQKFGVDLAVLRLILVFTMGVSVASYRVLRRIGNGAFCGCFCSQDRFVSMR